MDVIRSKYSLGLLITIIVLFSLTLVGEKEKEDKAKLPPKGFKLAKLKPKKWPISKPKIKRVSFKTIDSKMGGGQMCVCPLCHLLLVNSKGCHQKCPTCHKSLMKAIYAGPKNPRLAKTKKGKGR